MDFCQIKHKVVSSKRNEFIEVYPEFKVKRSKDLMVRGGSFYAIWDPEKELWSEDEYDVQRLIDKELYSYADSLATDSKVVVKDLGNYSTGCWGQFKLYVDKLSNNYHQLDSKLTFAGQKVKKDDYISKRLKYKLEDGSCEAYEELISTLYDPEERAKLEWAIGAIVSGDSAFIQKFLVLYGDPGAGKSTVLNIIEALFEGYTAPFDAKALGSNNNQFSMEFFKENPLVAIQHDGDLSRIEDNTKLNSIVSHETMTMNEKYKSIYSIQLRTFLFMATNKAVKITDAKSGILRRLIVVKPSGRKLSPKRYAVVKTRLEFELGAIAKHCLDVYKKLGKDAYIDYEPIEMMYKTNAFFNFVSDCRIGFEETDGITLKDAYAIYKAYCEQNETDRIQMYKFKDELKNYFDSYDDILRIDGKQIRSWYSGFKKDKFEEKKKTTNAKDEKPIPLTLDDDISLLDTYLKDCPAQLAVMREGAEVPEFTWAKVKTKLCDIDTHQVHYVKPYENHIVIDFDLKDNDGNKDPQKNLEAASKWPPTYTEYSKSGGGIHLHYTYVGDISKVSRVYAEGIEVKVFSGNSSLRRRLTKCKNNPIFVLKEGALPLKREKMVNLKNVENENHLRNLIVQNLKKEVHASTKQSINFIQAILDEAYESGIEYDVSDLYNAVLAFANGSTNNSQYCLKVVAGLHFKSKEKDDISRQVNEENCDDRLVFFDIEVFPNLLLVVWKFLGSNKYTVWFNPSPQLIANLSRYKLVGYNCRRYDNHVLYARMVGKDINECYLTSASIIKGDKDAFFGPAYNFSYADLYDICLLDNKMSLKQWELTLGINHKELNNDWNSPIDESKWELVADYCKNDVAATEAVYLSKQFQGDWMTRVVLSKISGLSINDTTNSHSKRIIFGDNRNPQSEFVYTDLSKTFPGYRYNPRGIPKEEYTGKIVSGKSIYKGIDPSEGGRAIGYPGIYTNVALLDIASMHPSTIEALNLFGDRYTKRFVELKNARLAVKHKDYDALKVLLGGALYDISQDVQYQEHLADALKVVINSVYGLTAASFANEFKDPRNIDNIVAKRGALFMIDLEEAVTKAGYKVAHIKTDSIKIANADDYIINFIAEFGKKYGYTFEHEATYDRMCLINDAVYVAKYNDKGIINKGGKHANEWTATGEQFKHPIVFKNLFSKEQLTFDDYCETKKVTTALYLDMNENLPDVTAEEKLLAKLKKKDNVDPAEIAALEDDISKGHSYHFVGRVGKFCPIMPGKGGGLLKREKDGKYSTADGAMDFRWLESDVVKSLHLEESIDQRYSAYLINNAIETISEYGDFEQFVSDEPYKPQIIK